MLRAGGFMNKAEKNAIAIYERELREQRVFGRFSYFQMAQRLIEKHPMLAYVALADKLSELAKERNSLNT
jgi:hypothetical protein